MGAAGMQNIYCVEDDQNIRDLVVYALGTAGFGAKGFEKSSELYEEMKKELPVLILLDIMLPEEDGMQILRHIRSDMTTRNIPVIILSGTVLSPILGAIADYSGMKKKLFVLFLMIGLSTFEV